MILIVAAVILGLIIIYLVVDSIVLDHEIKESHSRIMEKINGVIDGVKTFFTVTLVDKISSAFGPEEAPEDEVEL